MTQPNPGIDPETAFGSMVRERRRLLGWTQDQLRRRLLDGHGIDLSKTAMARLEQGNRPIRFNEVFALSQLMDIYLPTFGGSPTRSQGEEADHALYEANAALMDTTQQLAAVEAEVAVASEAAASAASALQQAQARLITLQTRHRDLSNLRSELTHSLSMVADARRRAEMLGESDGDR